MTDPETKPDPKPQDGTVPDSGQADYGSAGQQADEGVNDARKPAPDGNAAV